MRRSAAITALAVTLGLLTACTPEHKDTPTPIPSVSSATPELSPAPSDDPTTAAPEPSPSPSPSETLDADQQAARDVVNEFFRLSDELTQDPDLSLQPLADITRGQTQTVYLEEIIGYREMGAIQVGDLLWRVLSISPATEIAEETVVTVEVCTDSSQLDIVNQDTRISILPAGRPTNITWTINALTPTGNRWFVGEVTSTIDSECEV